jgi:hypothetical protein
VQVSLHGGRVVRLAQEMAGRGAPTQKMEEERVLRIVLLTS